MAGLLDDPTKNNPVAAAVQTMADKAFGVDGAATPFVPDRAAGGDKNSTVPTTIMSAGSHAQQAQGPAGPVAPDQTSPLPLPNPTPTPAVATPATPDNRTVEQRLNGLISQDSDYIKMAEARGLADANKRGLANSSIAVGAARGAAIDRALPIAQADTDIAAQDRRLDISVQAEKDRLAQAAGYDMDRLQADAANNLIRDAQQATSAQDLARVQGTIQSALQSQGNTEQIQRMGVDLANQLQLTSQQLTNDLAKISASGDQDIRRLVEAGNQERVTLQQSLASQDRQAMANAMVNIFQIEQQLRSALLSNDKISATERAAYERTITALGQPIRDYVSQLFGPPANPNPATTPAPGDGGTGGPILGGNGGTGGANNGNGLLDPNGPATPGPLYDAPLFDPQNPYQNYF